MKSGQSIRAILFYFCQPGGVKQIFWVPNSDFKLTEMFMCPTSTPLKLPHSETMNTANIVISSSEPSLKRRRTEELHNLDDGVTKIAQSPIRDEQYYMNNEGADCVILVGNVLFKVGRCSEFE